MRTNCFKLILLNRNLYYINKRQISGLGLWNEELTLDIKHRIEEHWSNKLGLCNFNENDCSREKYYVLSMFPYPSGQLHMGHVRVYSISDSVARFNHLKGKNVFHPMGWDSFGLPAENAAIDRNIAPDNWTKSNISQMKEHLQMLGCSFDWNREITTCNPNYYRWTQYIFLKLFEAGLAYQKEALVNWDPVDQTVLADEQVDSNGCSWRSGARVEKKFLKQWFIKTTRFAKDLSDGLNDPILDDWRDIKKLQNHWIGECNGVQFDFGLQPSVNNNITVWTKYPEFITHACFIIVSPEHVLCKANSITINGTKKLDLNAVNPLTGNILPIFVSDQMKFPHGSDSYLGIPVSCDYDRSFAIENNIPILEFDQVPKTESERLKLQQKNCSKARHLNVGGDWCSFKLKDWLISRQRYWGTPIPIIHCDKCGPQPVPTSDLAVELPKLKELTKKGLSPLLQATEWMKTRCPKCGNEAKRETDTMDTFVDSSWYFLRYIDSNNTEKPFSAEKVKDLVPVDLYIGGKEHAVLHLYYARFIHHFLHSINLVPEREPFKRLLVQGMVMGRSYRIKGTGEYVTEDQVDVLDAKKNKAVHKETKQPIVMAWEKMSKSKLNGVEPSKMFEEYGIDTTRLLILADIAPTSHRNWNSSTFPGILNWQRRLWLTIQSFIAHRTKLPDVDYNDKNYKELDDYMFDSRNYYVKGVTFNICSSQQLSVGISKLQGLTNSVRKVTPDVMAHSAQFERCLAVLIIMLAPMAPHFASELWTGFLSAPNRLNEEEIKWDKNVLDQDWPEVDSEYYCDIDIIVHGKEITHKITRRELDTLTHNTAMKIVMDLPSVRESIANRILIDTKFVLYKGCGAEFFIYTKKQTNEIQETVANC